MKSEEKSSAERRDRREVESRGNLRDLEELEEKLGDGVGGGGWGVAVGDQAEGNRGKEQVGKWKFGETKLTKGGYWREAVERNVGIRR